MTVLSQQKKYWARDWLAPRGGKKRTDTLWGLRKKLGGKVSTRRGGQQKKGEQERLTQNEEKGGKMNSHVPTNVTEFWSEKPTSAGGGGGHVTE